MLFVIKFMVSILKKFHGCIMLFNYRFIGYFIQIIIGIRNSWQILLFAHWDK